MSYHNLTNEEIVFMYMFSKSIKEQYETVFELGTITQIIPTELGTMKVSTEIPSDLISDMLEAKHYILMRSIHDKLKPLYELILDVEPDIITDIKEIFEKNN